MPAAPDPVRPVPRRTLAAPFSRRGVGVHTGRPATVTVRPAPWGTGIRFRLGPEVVPARIDHVVPQGGATWLRAGERRVGTVEHLLAALYGSGISDAEVEVEGEEVPVLDGSAAPWVEALAAAGRIAGPPADPLVLQEALEVEARGGRARAWPHPACELSVDVDFGRGGPRGHASVVLEGDRFQREVAWARTFVLERDIPTLRAAGRGLGATPTDTVVWGADGPLVSLRAPDEPVRHKLLDLVGDLALLGRPLRGRIHVERGSHALHHALVRMLLS